MLHDQHTTTTTSHVCFIVFIYATYLKHYNILTTHTHRYIKSNIVPILI